MNKNVVMGLSAAAVLIALVAGGMLLSKEEERNINITEENVGEYSAFLEENSMQPEEHKQKTIAVLHTSEGDITLELYADMTPKTVENFITLAEKGFYNNTVFHRVIKGFMIQGGDPKGDGTGGPGYTFPDEPFEGEYTRGTIAMANAGPNTNGSQFFIMHADYPLPKNYVIFGRVAGGMEAVDKIASAPVITNAFGEPSKPVKPAVVDSVEVRK